VEKLWHGLVIFVNISMSTKNDFAWLESPGGHMATMITRTTHGTPHVNIFSRPCLFSIVLDATKATSSHKGQNSNGHLVSKQKRDHKA